MFFGNARRTKAVDPTQFFSIYISLMLGAEACIAERGSLSIQLETTAHHAQRQEESLRALYQKYAAGIQQTALVARFLCDKPDAL